MRRYKIELKEFSEINITPFTDVVLVLLIIFMIASPVIITGALQIKLPKSSSAQAGPKKKIEVYLTQKNEIYIDNLPVAENELKAALNSAYMRIGSSEVVLNADENVRHGDVVKFLDKLKEAGATKLMIGTVKK